MRRPSHGQGLYLVYACDCHGLWSAFIPLPYLQVIVNYFAEISCFHIILGSCSFSVNILLNFLKFALWIAKLNSVLRWVFKIQISRALGLICTFAGSLYPLEILMRYFWQFIVKPLLGMCISCVFDLNGAIWMFDYDYDCVIVSMVCDRVLDCWSSNANKAWRFCRFCRGRKINCRWRSW